jgi:hypothetical protein
MIKYPGLALLFFWGVLSAQAQVIPAARRVNWSVAGLTGGIPAYTASVSINAFGGVGDGATNNSPALQNAMAAFGGGAGVVFFPPGVYRFTSSVDVPDSIIIRGAASDSTTLLFDLGGVLNHCFTVYGSQGSQVYSFTASALKDSSVIKLDQSTGLQPGDHLRIYQDDSALVTSSWAYKSVGQIVRISALSGNDVTVTNAFRKDYVFADSCKAVAIVPARGTGFECFRIHRADATTQQTSNLDFDKAVDCWVKGIESDSCNFAHVSLRFCSNILVAGSYFHHAFAYGGSGQAYGVVAHFATGECLVVNNIFEHLRHSMLLQAGANGNVFAYNYSFDPFWVQSPFPSNASGDLVLHGNYPFCNLFEGNIVQNMVIDDSHGENGPYNTLFRNRGALYGLVMNNNPPTDSQNFAGNEISNSSQGLYLLSGTGHFEFGNNFKGTIVPSGTSSLPDSSYYLNAKPGFFPAGMTWPSLGIPNALNAGTIPAKVNQANGPLTSCSSPAGGIGITDYTHSCAIFPNPAYHEVIIESVSGLAGIFDLSGRKVLSHTVCGRTVIDVSLLAGGLYLLRIDTDGESLVRKLVIAR